MASDPLDQPARPITIEALFQQKLLSARARDEAFSYLKQPVDWARWADRLLLILGAALMLSGVIFFVAYNWNDLGELLKLGGVQVLLFGCAFAAWRVGWERLLGQVLLMAACILVGVALAVYGQVYQTGADAYELFVAWAFLILPWVFAGRLGVLWLLWLALLNTAVLCYFDARGRWFFGRDEELFGCACATLGVLNAAALAAREVAVRRGCACIAGKWLRWVLALGILSALFPGTFIVIIQPGRAGPWLITTVCLMLAALGAGFVVYRRALPDLGVLGTCVLCLCVLVNIAAGRGLWEFVETAASDWRQREIIFFLAMGIIVLVVFSLGAFWLHACHKAMVAPLKEEEDDE